MSAITVRRAVLEDLGQLVPLFDRYRQFYGRCSDEPAAAAFLRQRFERGESIAFIVFDGEVAAGFTQLYPSFSSVSLARIFVLNDLFVEERSRRKGIAFTLIGAATEFARANGAVYLSLSTATTNKAAQALYASAGWVRDDEFLVYNLALTR